MVNSTSAVGLAEKLAEQVNNKNCIVFVGSNFPASASDPIGPPSPALLALELALSLGGQFEDYSLPWIAQYYVDRFDANKLHQFVVERIDTAHYAPHQVHFLLAQLPFNQIVYMAQDSLMHDALKQRKVAFNYVLESDELLSQPSERLLIQPYGSVSNPVSLKLTADERRTTFVKRHDLAQYLQIQVYTHHSLFIGFSQGDPDFREFYHFLRPKVNNLLPLARIVQPEATKDDIKYWSERNAEAVQMDSLVLLKQLETTLGLSVPVEPPRDTQPFAEEERSRRKNIILEFSQQLGLGSPVESGAQLKPIANGLATLRQALSEHRKSGTIMLNQPASDQGFDARLILQEGNTEWAEGNLTRAREAFEEAIQRDPELIDAYVSLHHLLVEIGEMKMAVEMYQQIVKRDSDRAFIPPRYKLLNILGRTSVGVSYHCRDTDHGSDVVVTILHRALSHKSDVLTRFESEVRTLKHPRICQFVELGIFHARNYLVTEYAGSRSLREYLKDKPAEERDISEIFNITNQINEALVFGETKGVPHLDLRPENILLTDQDQGVVLNNYGFSRLAHIVRLSGRAMDRQRTDYEAPEQRADELGDQRSDVYALGTIMYEMLTGTSPGVGTYQTVSEAHPQAEESLDVLIDHARALDPSKRYQTIEEMKIEAQRISLTTEYRFLSQYTRIVLARLSKIYAACLSRKGIWFTLVVAFLLLTFSASIVNLGDWLISGIRSFTIFFTTSLITSALAHSIVREVGRVRGLGSLIASGRGIGASFGLLLCAYLLRTTNWGDSGGLPAMMGGDFLGYLLSCLSVIVLMVIGVLIILHVTGWFFHRRSKHYTFGFYSAFLILFALLALLLLKGPPPYILIWG